MGADVDTIIIGTAVGPWKTHHDEGAPQGVSSSLCKRPRFVFEFGDGVAGEGGSFPFPCTINVIAVTVFTPPSFPGTASAPATGWGSSSGLLSSDGSAWSISGLPGGGPQPATSC